MQELSTHVDEVQESETNYSTVIGPPQAVAAALRTTLGPNGMDKMIVEQNGTVVVTNTGSSILNRVDVEDPTARMVMEAAETQAQTVSDGTTTTVLLVGELLEAAESLLEDGLHPTSIVDGYAKATAYATERLQEYATPVSELDRDQLHSIAATTVTGRWDDTATSLFAELAVSGLQSVDFDSSRLTLHARPGGSLDDSVVVDGIAVDMDASSTSIDVLEAPELQDFSNPRIALVDAEISPVDTDASATVEISDIDDLDKVREHERDSRSAVVQSVRELDIDVLFCQKSIDDTVRTALSQSGVLPVERTRQDEFDAISQATGAQTALAVDGLDCRSLGNAGHIHRESIGGTESLLITDCQEESHASIVLRGGTPHVSEEVNRVVADCVDAVRLALRAGSVLPGGGATAMALSRDLSEYADGIGGREQFAVQAFANALECIPRTLAENAGLDPVDTLVALRNQHYDGATSVGVDESGDLCDMHEGGVIGPTTVLDACLKNALETGALLLRIDDTLEAESGQRTEHAEHNHGHDGQLHTENDTDGYPWALSH